jgi:cyclomaltodextrinase
VPYTSGDVFDAVMFYQVYRPARYFFAKTNYEIDATQLADSLSFHWNRLLPANRYAMMNVSSSHDTPRLLTCFYNPNKYKAGSTPNDDKAYKTGKPDAETYQRLRLYLVHLFTSIGSPNIWNGEEMGMWGADDPDCRKPLWWKGRAFSPETRTNYQDVPKVYDAVGFDQAQFEWYKKLIRLRKENPVLVAGDIDFFLTEGKKLAYRRFDAQHEMLVYFNMEATPQTFTLPPSSRYVDALTGKKIRESSLSLAPLTAAVLKKVP